MTRDDVQRWLDRYVAAWMAYDQAAIGDLFSANAAYRYHPWDEPLTGREAIVRDWLNPGGDPAGRDRPGTVEARYECYAVDGDRAVAIGDTTYRDAPGGPIVRRYANAWLIEFDADGRCRSFIEYFMKQKL
ncbi:MAG: nuclear transport factor 2 family protein [Chloroflexi bacterium]|nr:nuclear transport factor 2 family protein [Chloroflexota bacterium]